MNVDKIRLIGDHAIGIRTNFYNPTIERRFKCNLCGKSVDKLSRNKSCSSCYTKQYRYNREITRKRRFKAAFVEPIRRTKVYQLHNWTCAMCGIHTPKELIGTTHRNAPTLDHVIPLSKGGLHAYSNVQLLCRYCNCSVKRDLIKTE